MPYIIAQVDKLFAAGASVKCRECRKQVHHEQSSVEARRGATRYRNGTFEEADDAKAEPPSQNANGAIRLPDASTTNPSGTVAAEAAAKNASLWRYRMSAFRHSPWLLPKP
jgi:hypothetical protein